MILPCLPDDVQGRFTALTGQYSEQVMRRFSVEQRLYQGLDYRNRAIVGATIAPGFQKVSLGNMPVAGAGGLVSHKAELSSEFDVGKRPGEIEVGGGVVDRVSPDDQKKIYLPGLHVRNEGTQRFSLIDRLDFHRVGVVNGLADVAQCLVDGMGQGMHRRGLLWSGNDDSGPRVFLQIPDQGRNPVGRVFENRDVGFEMNAQFQGYRRGEALDGAAI